MEPEELIDQEPINLEIENDPSELVDGSASVLGVLAESKHRFSQPGTMEDDQQPGIQRRLNGIFLERRSGAAGAGRGGFWPQ